MEDRSDPTEFASLYARLNRRDEAERKAAIAEAHTLPADTLIAFAHYEEARHREDMKQVGRSFLPMPLLAFPLWAFGMATHHPAITFLSFGISGVCGYRIYRRNPSLARESLAEIVSTSDDPRLLGVSLVMLNENPRDPQIYRLVRVGIKKLLPRVPLDGTAAWHEDYTSVLLKQLDFYDIELAEIILNVLAVYGSSQTVPALTGMAETEPGGSDRMRRVRDTARKSLSALQARLQEKAVSDQLLRPSEKSGDGLLRPSQEETDRDADELLRGH